MNWLLNRLKERSSWLGLFTLFGLLGMKLNPELQELITQAILAVAAIVAFVYRESTHERSTDQPAGPAQALPPIDLIGRPERYAPPRTEPLESTHQPPISGTDPARHRRASDEWLRDTVPSESQFKTPTQSNRGQVGWNDDN
jgi:hypothetical protein